MTKPAKRLIVIVAAFCLVLAGGTVWLAGTVINAREDQAAADPAVPGPGEPEDPPRGPGGRGNGPPVPKRTFDVGGVTLNNDSPDNTCTYFTNLKFDIPVRVTGVVLSRTTPGTVLSSKRCPGDDPGTPRCRAGVTLRPKGGACHIGIRVQDGRPAGFYETYVGLALMARCPSRDVVPCAGLHRDYRPTPAHPVDAFWTEDGASLSDYVDAPETVEPGPDGVEPTPDGTEPTPEVTETSTEVGGAEQAPDDGSTATP